MSELAQARLKELFHYDPETGVFTRINRGKRRRKVGVFDKDGYHCVNIDGKNCRAHRLAWLYVYGKWPQCNLDHINRNPADNRIANLREATQAQNMHNKRRPKNNTSGIVGVSWINAARRWMAYMTKDGRSVNIGTFKTLEDAARARESAITYRGEFLPR